MTNIHIREAQPDDFPAILRLYRQLQASDPHLENGKDRLAFDQILASPGLFLFVLTQDSKVVASTYLNIIPNITRSASPYAIIENVITDEALRGQGLGKQLMLHTLRYAEESGCYKVMLLTGSKRAATHAFYRSCGFEGGIKTGYIVRYPAGR